MGKGKRGPQGGAAMATDAKTQLFQALKAHTSELEIERDVASDRDLDALGRRIGSARLLLEWLSKALEPKSVAYPQLKHRRPRALKGPLAHN
jgi:hypothetical protein